MLLSKPESNFKIKKNVAGVITTHVVTIGADTNE